NILCPRKDHYPEVLCRGDPPNNVCFCLEPLLKNQTIGNVRGAHAETPHAATTTPPRSAMNSRRLIIAPEAKTRDSSNQLRCSEGVGLCDVRFGSIADMLCKRRCPLHPRKQTCALQLEMSVLGQKRTCCGRLAVSQKAIESQQNIHRNVSHLTSRSRSQS